MPRISNLRLLLSSSSSSSSFSHLRPLTTLLPSNLRRHVFAPLRSSSSSGGRRDFYSPSFTRRGESTFMDRDRDRQSKGPPMDETKSFGFNKKRAQGREGSGLPKKELQLKKRPRANPVSTISYVQILGTGMDTQDTSPSVLLFFDHQRFIFNAGEGLQRFCTQHKIKLSKIDHIFLSRVCSETAGGLPGLLLTLAAMGEEGMSVNIWGPSDLKYLVDAMKSFIPNAAMVHTKSFGPTPSDGAAINPEFDQFKDPIVILEDDVVKISAVLLWPRESQGREFPIGCMDVSSNILEGNDKNAIDLKPGDMSVVYICELPEIKGRFHPERAKEKGIKPGPDYRELQLGNSVFSKHLNIMVHPSDVMDPSIPGPVVLIVDCPTKSHFQRLLSLDSLSNYYSVLSSERSQKNVSCMIHLSPTSIISDHDYQTWMKRFGSAQHIIAGHEMKNAEIPIISASARIAARLNYLCSQFFPAPGFWSSKRPGLSSDSSFSCKGISDPSKIISAENLLKFTLRPRDKIGLDRSIIPNTLTASKTIDELLIEIPEIAEAAENVRNLWDRDKDNEEDNTLQEEPWLNENKLPNCLENIRKDDLEIVLLGTGSSQPSKYRNVSSIYINLFSKGGLLLDCGEGTLGQMKRRFGIEGADNALRGLRCVWISHIHADHHAGLARILTQRRDLLKGSPHDPLLVVGPRQLKRYLDAYRRLEDLDMLFLDCRHTTESSISAFEEFLESPDNEVSSLMRSPSPQQGLFTRGSPMQSCWKRPGVAPDISMAFPILKSMKEVLREAGLDSLVSFPVVHCPQAYGVVLKASQRVNSFGKLIEGWKVVYSGDTRPCPELTQASRGATVLINEATFEDGMVDEAIARNHSTTEEAIRVGAAAGVYRIILTHFSQRYPKIPVFGESHMHKTCIAFDLMSVNIADLPVLPRVLPYLKLLFKNEMAGDESEDVLEESVGVTY
ncbi:hypothetical protein SAY86_017434 [Trapa natans]|uniref:ribonuclease Z n=1 Tax=Trapa natans TaxID=22666 RepID=A0AAN7R6G2_TRANT|nr:hypothetical protein SAY86_017434 [Trapa natans]